MIIKLLEGRPEKNLVKFYEELFGTCLRDKLLEVEYLL